MPLSTRVLGKMIISQLPRILQKLWNLKFRNHVHKSPLLIIILTVQTIIPFNILQAACYFLFSDPNSTCFSVCSTCVMYYRVCHTSRVLFDRLKHWENARTKSRFRLQAGTFPLTWCPHRFWNPSDRTGNPFHGVKMLECEADDSPVKNICGHAVPLHLDARSRRGVWVNTEKI